jgi:hypothetical protein
MQGLRLRATPRRLALFALVAIAATDRLDDLSALVKAQGRLLEQMQQQIQALELAARQGGAQGAEQDELSSAPGRPGRQLSAPATQRKTWHHSILHSFDDPSSCGLHAELNSDATGPMDITRSSDGNVSMGYGGATSATQPAAFELNHPANCRTATLTSNHPLVVPGSLTAGSLQMLSPPVISDVNLRVASGAFGLKSETFTVNYVNTGFAAVNGAKLAANAFANAAAGDGVKFFYAEPMSAWCLTAGCPFSIRLSTRAENGFSQTPADLGTNMFVHSVGEMCDKANGVKLHLFTVSGTPGRSNCLFRFVDSGSGLYSLQPHSMNGEINVMCDQVNGVCAEGAKLHFWGNIRFAWTLIK